MLGWPSGLAAGCRPAYVGSIPTPSFRSETSSFCKDFIVWDLLEIAEELVQTTNRNMRAKWMLILNLILEYRTFIFWVHIC